MHSRTHMLTCMYELSHSLHRHAHYEVFAFLLNCFCTCELHSYSSPSPKQLDYGDPPKEREGKSAQDSTWGNSLANDCKVVG